MKASNHTASAFESLSTTSRPFAPAEVERLLGSACDLIRSGKSFQNICCRLNATLLGDGACRATAMLRTASPRSCYSLLKLFREASPVQRLRSLVRPDGACGREVSGYRVAQLQRLPVPQLYGYLVHKSRGGAIFAAIAAQWLHGWIRVEKLMELLHKKDVTTHSVSASRLSEALFHEVAQMHFAGVIHGDLHLSNIVAHRSAMGTWSVRFIDLSRMRRAKTPTCLIQDLGYLLYSSYNWATGRWTVYPDELRASLASYMITAGPLLLTTSSAHQVCRQVITAALHTQLRVKRQFSREQIVHPINLQQLESIVLSSFLE